MLFVEPLQGLGEQAFQFGHRLLLGQFAEGLPALFDLLVDVAQELDVLLDLVVLPLPIAQRLDQMAMQTPRLTTRLRSHCAAIVRSGLALDSARGLPQLARGDAGVSQHLEDQGAVAIVGRDQRSLGFLQGGNEAGIFATDPPGRGRDLLSPRGRDRSPAASPQTPASA